MGKKSRIQPNKPAKASHYNAANRTPVVGYKSRRVLKEFEGWGGGVELKKLSRPCGPRVLGYICVASWSVKVPTDDQEAFQSAWEEIGKDPVRLCHGTGAMNVGAITRDGMKAGKWGMFGAGIYFGQITKAIVYAGGFRSRSAWRRRRKTNAHELKAAYVFEADVLLGNPFVATNATKWSLRKLREAGFDSVHGSRGVTASWGGHLRNDEWVVYSRDQILLDKLHEYHAVQGSERHVAAPIVGLCDIVRNKDIKLDRAQRAFADVLKRQRCGRTSYTKLEVEGRYGTKLTIWACKECIEESKVRIGSKVSINSSSYRKRGEVKVLGKR